MSDDGTENTCWVFGGRSKSHSCCHSFGRHWGRGFHLALASLQKSQNCWTLMGGQEEDALQRRHFSSVADSKDTETVDRVWSSFLGDYCADYCADSKTCSGGQSNLCVVCMYQLFGKKKQTGKNKKKAAVAAEPSVTFDVIEICLQFCHFCHSQPMYALMFLTESAS